MLITNICNQADFSNSVIPTGKVMLFTTEGDDGAPMLMYKDADGNVGPISGGAADPSMAVTYGYFINDGSGNISFQGIRSPGILAGEKESVDSVSIVNTGVAQPDYISAESIDFYRCVEVDTYHKTWIGYKAELVDGSYHFADTVTTDLTYGDGYTPVIGLIYDSKAMVLIKSVYTSADPSLVFHAPLVGESTVAATGQVITLPSGNYLPSYEQKNGRYGYFVKNYQAASEVIDLSNLPFGSDHHTICGWFMWDSIPAAGYPGLFGYGNAWAFYFDYQTTKNFAITCNPNRAVTFSFMLSAATWYHIATTYDGEKLTLYINGENKGESTVAPNFEKTSDSKLYIGKSPRNLTATGAGGVSDVRIYNRALSADELLSIMEEPQVLA